MRVIFMGTPDFSVPTLQKLAAAEEVVAVITQPDRPKGRKGQLSPPPVKMWAEQEGFMVLQPEKVKEPGFAASLQELKPDVIVVVAYGQILPESILNLPPLGCINVHASLLPKYRGASPIQHAILDGEETTGVTTMFMEKGLDTGDMLLKKEVPILASDDFESLNQKLSLAGADVLIETLEKLKSNSLERIPQNDAESTYAPILTREFGAINWLSSSKAIYDMVRGLNPWPGAYTFLGSEKLKIWKVLEAEGSFSGESGEIVRIQPNECFIVKTGDGGLSVTELQAPGKKRISAGDFMRGSKLEQGMVFK